MTEKLWSLTISNCAPMCVTPKRTDASDSKLLPQIIQNEPKISLISFVLSVSSVYSIQLCLLLFEFWDKEETFQHNVVNFLAELEMP